MSKLSGFYSKGSRFDIVGANSKLPTSNTVSSIFADAIFGPSVALDIIAPILTSPTATTTGATTASGTVSTNEANGTLYYLATTNATESVATVKAGSSQAVSATGVQNVSFTGLTGSTTYYAHYVHTDAANNDSARVSSASFTTNGVQTYPVRYIRDRLNGSLGNGASYFVEIQAYDASSTNIALNKTVTANFTPGQGILSQLVNGNTSTDDYVASFDANAAVIVDLGAEYQIASISRWHYYGDGRTFYDTKTETSLDGIVWVTIFDSNVSGTYAENSSGKNDLTVPPIVTLDNRQIGFIVPAYGNSSTQWSTYTDTADTAPTWSVFNPESGPGIVYNSTYNDYLTSYRAAGGKVLAYVSTSYAGTLNTTRTVSAVKEDIQIYMSWYGSNLDGFFLDELTSANNQTYLDYYREVMDYIKDINPHLFVVGNPGAAVDEVYANQRLADNLVIFENTAAVFQDYTPPAWINNYDRHMFSYLVYAATESQSNNVIDRARAENVQYVFITDDILDNPWDTAPTYWSAENTKAEGPDAPSIWQHPVDSIGSLGSSVTFSVSATGLAILTYQWYLDSGSGFNPISGAISSTYITPTITSGMNNYKYRVVVSNSEGSTVSFRANLTVTKPIKYWNGSTWITKPVKQWNGYRWATRASRYWNGSAWI